MKKRILIALLIAFNSAAFAQKAYLAEVGSLAPLENFKPDKPCKIVVNLNLTKNELGIVEICIATSQSQWRSRSCMEKLKPIIKND